MNNIPHETKKSEAYSCRLFMAGDINKAKIVIGHFCRTAGWCVTITPTDYIYSGGQEAGFIIEAINYARFPSNKQEIRKHITALANKLANELNQRSYSIMDDICSEYIALKMPFEQKFDTQKKLSKALKTDEGRTALAKSLVEPIRRSLEYQALGCVSDTNPTVNENRVYKKKKLRIKKNIRKKVNI